MKKKWIILILILSLAVGFGLSFNSTTLVKFILYGAIHSALNFIIVYGLTKGLLKEKTVASFKLVVGLVGFGVLVVTYSHLLLFPSLLGSNGTFIPNHFRTNTITGQCNYGGKQTDGDKYLDPWYYKIGCTQGQEEALSKAGFDVQVFTAACETACTDVNVVDYCHTSASKNSDAHFCKVLVDCPAIECSNTSSGIL